MAVRGTRDALDPAVATAAPMIRWIIVFLLLAVAAAILEFGGVAGAAAGIARLLCYVLMALYALAIVAQAVGPRRRAA
ncbi:MAG: DUF1328 domain-containing protein [Planctomycetales bacterium]|nr:DUF1328 domain-containing protein [Planctomycetales bacterium]